MRREEADTQRQQLQYDDREHTYLVLQQASGQWEVVRIDIPRPTSQVVAERGSPADPPEDARPFLIRQIPPYGPPGF